MPCQGRKKRYGEMSDSQHKHITLSISIPHLAKHAYENALFCMHVVVSINRSTRAHSCARAQSCSVRVFRWPALPSLCSWHTCTVCGGTGTLLRSVQMSCLVLHITPSTTCTRAQQRPLAGLVRACCGTWAMSLTPLPRVQVRLTHVTRFFLSRNSYDPLYQRGP